jgi:2-oxoglutarate ferredoxin oxidoreductase subunit gamma
MMLDVIMAGHGGQGIMLMGQLLAYAAMLEGKHVTWMPSYGPEMRGGTANCTVVLSDEPVGSPVVSRPQAVVAMNIPSFLKFEPVVKEGGILIYNSSLIKLESERNDILKIAVRATETAAELGNIRVANMVALGALIAATKVVSMDSAMEVLPKVLPAHRQDLISLNLQALESTVIRFQLLTSNL